ncbi:MAG: hypothetical protein PHO56_02170 [Patescibacteria group bacterium]|nr:hypothetical protein [Patescibacteria group bacterium]
MYRDALNNSGSYQKKVEEIKKLRDEKKQIELGVKEEFASEFDKLEILNNEIKNDQQLLSDIVMSQVSKGEKIELEDEYENKLEPIFSVRFKKIS